ncbi:sugar phosphate exchanger 3-like isoform X3 [Dreissena polymorpha]|uniref:sugar phosphate exchanger 3-like isoform X3 n=1 Tax=Dreissena polymorpha TaxID=45954 RepID=UPI00226480EF|nr:sugar phosphate exchanger 3-like isoform X3 [Dreissena polymorpha]
MWSYHHIITFILTFSSYALFHATRKTFSNVKSTISSEWSSTPGNETHCNKPDKLWTAHHMYGKSDDAETYLGVLDAVFMIAYAVGLYISGVLGDRYELRKVLSIGMCSTAVMVFVFGCVFEWTHFYNQYLYVIVWILNGLLQSTGWPTVVAVMGNWFGKSSRGFVLGVWSACASVGNIIGALMVSQVLHYGYDFAFLVTSTALFAGGVINIFGLVNCPKEIGLPSPDEDMQDVDLEVNKAGFSPDIQYDTRPEDVDDTAALLGHDGDSDVQTQTLVLRQPPSGQALSFKKALLLPGVLLYAFAYFCLKLVNYSFFFWLPYYLHASFGWKESTADKISIWYDIGGIVGGTFAGVISDCLGKRSVVVVPMLVLAIPSLVGFKNSPNDMTMNAVLMTITGFFIGGVANLISAAISADLGKQGPIQGNKEALATVTGIVDGTGSVGAALGQILVPLLQEKLQWPSVFYLFIIMTVCTILCIIPMLLREVPELWSDIKVCCSKYTFTWYCGLYKRQAKDLVPVSINDDDEDLFSD